MLTYDWVVMTAFFILLTCHRSVRTHWFCGQLPETRPSGLTPFPSSHFTESDLNLDESWRKTTFANKIVRFFFFFFDCWGDLRQRGGGRLTPRHRLWLLDPDCSVSSDVGQAAYVRPQLSLQRAETLDYNNHFHFLSPFPWVSQN